MSQKGMGLGNVVHTRVSQHLSRHRSKDTVTILFSANGFTEVTPRCGKDRKVVSKRQGFTIIEVMVVVIIVAIASAVAIPSFVKSFRGAKLKVGARTVNMASRLARSTAVLQNQHMALLFFPDASEIEMVHVKMPNRRGQQSQFLNNRDQRRLEGMLDSDEEEAESTTGEEAVSIAVELARKLPEGVRISNIETAEESAKFEDAAWVNFYPNGMSDAFKVTLIDEDNKEAEVSVDPISGRVSIDYVSY